MDELPSVGNRHDIVAIGASAGGVDAVCRLLGVLPNDLSAAIVIVVHQPMYKDSNLPAVLSRSTSLQVVAAKAGERLHRAICHVGPPQTILWIGSDLEIELLDDGFYRIHRIDACFHSLALHGGKRVIGVVMSSMLADGAIGLRAIRDAGGLALVQSPRDARFGDMPQHAIEKAHPVDLIGTADQLGEAIIQMVGRHAGPRGRELLSSSESRPFI